MKMPLVGVALLLASVFLAVLNPSPASCTGRPLQNSDSAHLQQEKGRVQETETLPENIAKRRQQLEEGASASVRDRLRDAGRKLAAKPLGSEEVVEKELSKLIRKHFRRATREQRESLAFLVLCSAWDSSRDLRAKTRAKVEERARQIEDLKKRKEDLLGKKDALRRPTDSGTIASRGGTLEDVERSLAETGTQENSLSVEYLQLQQVLQQENRTFTMISNIMKTKYDEAKSAITNVR